MQRFEHQEDLIDLGAVSSETKGLPIGDQDDVLGPKFQAPTGLSND